MLHFKTKCSLLDSTTILSTERLAKSCVFSDYEVIFTAEGEDPAANAIRFNEFVIIPSGFCKRARCLRNAGYRVKEINNTACAKIDGGISCLSLKF